MTEKKKEKKELSFEEALTRLETIVEEMEGGKVSLEKMMAHFEEGSKLVKYCAAQLNEVERKIELLVRKGDSAAAEPFDEKGLAKAPVGE
ncbi:MAG: exodeoxyribonuclease VII small subunit [Kiritimatiellae bacterium]|nr:exodeoxyribonuclease VII small subunit [Kiritimatiellia bacterium]